MNLTQLTDLKLYMGISNTSSDDALLSIISGVSRRVEVDCARTFGATNWIEYQTTFRGQSRTQVRNKPILTMSSVRWGYQTAIQVQVTSNNNSPWAAIQVMQNPLTSAKTCTLTSMSTGGSVTTTSFNLSDTAGTYNLCSQLVTAINLVSGFQATLLGGIDVPTRWLYPWTTTLRSYNTYWVQALGYPFIDLFGYVVDPIYGTLGFSQISSMDYAFPTDGSLGSLAFPSMYQGLCLDYRGGFENIPDDIRLLTNELCKDVYHQAKRDSSLVSESLADYSYSALSPLLRREYYADQIAPYRRPVIGGGIG